MSKRRGRKLQIEWQESEADLYKLFKAEKDRQKKSRLQAMWLLRKGKTGREASEVCGVNDRTVRRWVTWYREGGLEMVLSKLNGKQGGSKRWLTVEQEAELKKEIDTGRFHTGQAIAEWVRQEWQVEYKEGSIYSVLKRLGVRKKVPRRQADKADPAKQEAWKKGGSKQP